MKNLSTQYNVWIHALVPAQVTGHSNLSYSRYMAHSRIEAEQLYEIAAARLLDVNHWHQWAGHATASFQLVGRQGNEQFRPVQIGDYFRIDLPGPGNPAGKGEDWVQVQEVGERNNGHHRITFITVRAALSPLRQQNEGVHFFERTATSTFIVYRENCYLVAAVYGRNERPNTSGGGLITRLRNWLIYIGARLGLSSLQWKSLTKGLLQFDK